MRACMRRAAHQSTPLRWAAAKFRHAQGFAALLESGDSAPSVILRPHACLLLFSPPPPGLTPHIFAVAAVRLVHHACRPSGSHAPAGACSAMLPADQDEEHGGGDQQDRCDSSGGPEEHCCRRGAQRTLAPRKHVLRLRSSSAPRSQSPHLRLSECARLAAGAQRGAQRLRDGASGAVQGRPRQDRGGARAPSALPQERLPRTLPPPGPS